jgi:hypothetical protein
MRRARAEVSIALANNNKGGELTHRLVIKEQGA